MEVDYDIRPYISSDHEDIPILALRISSRRKLGMYLDLEATQPSSCGFVPDFNGLAECIGFDYYEICGFGRDKHPTVSLLNEWGNHPNLRPTLGNLVKYLLMLERVDILEDCKEIMRGDAEHYIQKTKERSLAIKPVQDDTVSQSPFDIDDVQVDETVFMTIQDVEAGGPTYYDAFVCYHPEGKDLEFVMEMIQQVEAKPHNLKLFVPHRDDLPGASRYTISAKLIQDRCKRMVIVMSPGYLQSAACDFQTKFAHALSPGSRSKKLVPVLISSCEVPNILKHVTTCDYTRGNLSEWFWRRLIKSLQAPLDPREIHVTNPSCLSDINMAMQSIDTSRFQSAVILQTPAKEEDVGSLLVSMPKGAVSKAETFPIYQPLSRHPDSNTCVIQNNLGSSPASAQAGPSFTSPSGETIVRSSSPTPSVDSQKRSKIFSRLFKRKA